MWSVILVLIIQKEEGQEIRYEKMTSAKQIVSTIFAVGFAAGLAVSSYYMSENINSKREYYNTVINKPNTQIAVQYNAAYEDALRLEESFRKNASWNSGSAIKAVQNDVYTKTNNMIVSLASIANNETYLNASVDIYKNILVFEKLETTADKYIQIQKEILNLEENVKKTAEQYEPNLASILEPLEHFENRRLGCNIGIVFGSIGVIGFGIWAGREWNEESLYFIQNRNSKRRVRNKV